jgi:hypothetical protein
MGGQCDRAGGAGLDEGSASLVTVDAALLFQHIERAAYRAPPDAEL